MNKGTVVLTDEIVKRHLTITDVITRVEDTYRWYGNGKVVMPSKITTDMSELGLPNWINAMPAYVQPCKALGIKWAGGFAYNPQHGMRYIRAYVLLNDPETGELLALIDGDWISDMRTGAQTAVAAKYLAVKAPRVVAIIGAGIQGMATARCLNEQYEVSEIRISDINPAAVKNFADRLQKVIAPPIKVSVINEEAVKGADIIVTATAADAALVKEEWVKPGALVSSIGSYQELEEELVSKADKLVVDHLEQNLHRGEFTKLFQRGILKESDIYGEISDIVAGKLPGRISSEERIIISPIGMGCLDIAIAGLLYERLLQNGDLENLSIA